MSRVSAGELQMRYETKHELLDFFDEMKAKIFNHFEDKGTSWKLMTEEQLLALLQKYLSKHRWIHVANIAFMLRNNEEAAEK